MECLPVDVAMIPVIFPTICNSIDTLRIGVLDSICCIAQYGTCFYVAGGRIVGDKGNNWMDEWVKSQQGYWQSWADMAQRGMRVPEPQRNPWADGLTQWWRTMSPSMPFEGREVFDRLMGLSRGYFTMAEQMSNQGASMQDGMGVVNGWLENMQKYWTEWVQNGGQWFNKDASAKDMMAFWDLPMDTLNRMVANMMPVPGDFTQAFHPESMVMGGPVREQTSRFLSIPAVGYTRESQEQFQQLTKLQMDYAAAMQAYQMAFGKVALQSTQNFQAHIQEETRQGKTFASLRETYDSWVEFSEAAYAEFVMTQEYQQLYGKLVNTLLAVKQQTGRMVDQGLEAMHMPTHAEISTLQLRQQELRRENLSLRKEIRAIHEELLSMREQRQAASANSAVVSKSVAKETAKPQVKPGAATKRAATKSVTAPKVTAKTAPKSTAKKAGGKN